MKNSDLANLHRARSRWHWAVNQAAELAQDYRDKLADLEISIQATVPDLKLPPRFHRSNPYFARGELRRPAIDVLREAQRRLAIREMALAALRAKGVRFPDPRTVRITRTRLCDTFAKLEARAWPGSRGWGKRRGE
jgi:hypothetical protein